MANIRGLGDYSSGSSSNRNPYGPPPGAPPGMVMQEPRVDLKAVRQVKSEKELENALKNARNRVTVVYWSAAWCAPCHRMTPSVVALSEKHSNVQFLKVDCQALPQLAQKYRVSALPYITCHKKQTVEDRFEGFKPERLEATILRLSSGSRYVTSGSGQRLGSAPSPAQQQASGAGAGAGGAGGGGDDPKVAQLVGMGFSATAARKGLAAVGGVLENAINWILEHPEANIEDSAGQKLGGTSSGGGAQPMDVDGGSGDGAADNAKKEPHTHQALCDRCKKQIVGVRYKCKGCTDFDLCPNCYPMRVMWHDDEHDFDAYEEEYLPPSEPKRKLTPEEKKAQVARLKALMEEKRRIREEDEARAKKERELRRRVEGKTSVEAKKKWEEQKIKMEADKLKRQKERDEAHKRKVLEKIRRERGVRKEGGASNSEQKSVPVKTRNYDSCTVQLRIPGQAALKWEGATDATLREIHTFVAQQHGGSFGLATTYPRKTYKGAELDSTTVKDAGLVPRGVLVVTKL